jgi:hypothetical protein
MSNPNLNIVGACERIRKEAATLAGQNYAFNMKKKTGALDFITSPENGGVDAKLITYDSGAKMAKLYILYDQRTKACETTHDCFQSVCDDGSTPVRKDATITIDNCLKTKVREYTNDDMVALCDNPEEFMKKRGFSDIRAAKESWSARILAELVGEIGINHQFDGGNVSAGTYKTLDLIGADSLGQPVPLPGNFAKMPLDYGNNQLTGLPWVVGQGNFELFWKLHGYSCCNSTTPYGEADIAGDVRFYIDQQANDILGTNKVLMGTYGAIHLLTFNENKQIEKMGTNTNQNMSITIADPDGYPFEWNLDFYWDICEKKWKSMYSLTWGLFNTFRDDSFSANSETEGSPDCSDELDGMKGVFGYNIT